MNVVRGGESALPAVSGEGARIAGLVALVQIVVLAFVEGNKGPNKYGPDPKERR